ncbi:DUF6879 family protein [Nocardia goodfellowii]|uniref:DUF6879 domain-containing protein n=1 Tax=Nocardia goodfellowii TaxID=882446 RepID=A0ABS4Q843_9NOCA|nr:DUF6879 family protein [Nocardia goodfellowii]MBP2187860.1 hypothetical protein [Nocardia goodfellowii]
MQLLQGEEIDDLLRSCESSAHHLEVLDTYETPEEAEPFGKFLAGEPDDYAWGADWWNLIREVTSTGRAVRRARVVTEPHTAYTRWGLVVANQNIAVGEEIRYLPRHLIDPAALSTDDFWLVDDRLLAFTVFEPSGRYVGWGISHDPVIVDHARAVWNRVWDKAIPHADYIQA